MPITPAVEEISPPACHKYASAPQPEKANKAIRIEKAYTHKCITRIKKYKSSTNSPLILLITINYTLNINKQKIFRC